MTKDRIIRIDVVRKIRRTLTLGRAEKLLYRIMCRQVEDDEMLHEINDYFKSFGDTVTPEGISYETTVVEEATEEEYSAWYALQRSDMGIASRADTTWARKVLGGKELRIWKQE